MRMLGTWRLLFALVAVSTVWMHVAIRIMERKKYPGLVEERFLSDVPQEPATQ